MLFMYIVAFTLPGKMVRLVNDSSKVYVKCLQITLKVNEKVHNFQQEEKMLIKRTQQSKVQLERREETHRQNK